MLPFTIKDETPFICYVRYRQQQMQGQPGMDTLIGLHHAALRFRHEWSGMSAQERASFHGSCEGIPVSRRNSAGDSRSGSLQTEKTRDNRFQQNEPNCPEKVDQMLAQGAAEKQHFVIINFSSYCINSDDSYVPAELGLTAFSLDQGIIDNYATLIDPMGFDRDRLCQAGTQCKTLAVPMPGFGQQADNYKRTMRKILSFMGKHPSVLVPRRATYLFCLQEDIEKVKKCLDWLVRKCIPGLKREFTVISLGILLQHFAVYGKAHYLSRMEIHKQPDQSMNAAGTEPPLNPETCPRHPGFPIQDGRHRTRCLSEVNNHTKSEESDPESDPPKVHDSDLPDNQLFVNEEMAETYLLSDDWTENSELACLHHAVNGGVSTCALNVTNRQALSMIDVLLGYFPEISPVEGLHFPFLNANDEKFKRSSMLAYWGQLGYKNFDPFDELNDSAQPEPKQLTEEVDNKCSENPTQQQEEATNAEDTAKKNKE